MIAPRYLVHRCSALLVRHIYAVTGVVEVTYRDNQDPGIEIRIPVSFPDANEWQVKRRLSALHVLPPVTPGYLALFGEPGSSWASSPIRIVLPAGPSRTIVHGTRLPSHESGRISSVEHGGYRASWYGPAARSSEEDPDSGIYELPDGSIISLGKGPAYNERPSLIHDNCSPGLKLKVVRIADGVEVLRFRCMLAQPGLHEILTLWPATYTDSLREIYFG